jgi:hypothetical protein
MLKTRPRCKNDTWGTPEHPTKKERRDKPATKEELSGQSQIKTAGNIDCISMSPAAKKYGSVSV